MERYTSKLAGFRRLPEPMESVVSRSAKITNPSFADNHLAD